MMKSIRINTVFLILTAVIFSACQLKYSKPKELVCPIPQQDCSQQKWNGQEIDTSHDIRKQKGFYYAIDLVEGINTIQDEWSLAIYDGRSAVMTYTDVNKQKLLRTHMIVTNRFRVLENVTTNIDGHVGSINTVNNKTVLAFIPDPENDNDFYNYYEQEYIPLKYIPGQSRVYEAQINTKDVTIGKRISNEKSIDEFNWESHPALSPDGNVAFFSSDRIGGYGGTDIWYSVRQGINWSEPVNCGRAINSKCDELSPFVSSDGNYLLFSSSGHENVGGYDLFKSRIGNTFFKDAGTISEVETRHFSKATNLRTPINTEFDELFPYSHVSPDSILYYSSNQAGRSESMLRTVGGFDIYVFQKIPYSTIIAENNAKEPEVPELPYDFEQDQNSVAVEIDPIFKFKGKVVNEKNTPLSNANVTIRELPKPDILFELKTDNKGNFDISLYKGHSYEITAYHPELFYESVRILVDKKDTTKEITHEFKLPEKLTLRINFPYDQWESPYRYTLDSNGNETTIAWQHSLDMLAKDILSNIENYASLNLIGHTDPVASVEYNRKLGQKRVDFVISELIKRGIPKELLHSRSASELEPLPKREDELVNIYHKRLRRVVIQKVMRNDGN